MKDKVCLGACSPGFAMCIEHVDELVAELRRELDAARRENEELGQLMQDEGL